MKGDKGIKRGSIQCSLTKFRTWFILKKYFVRKAKNLRKEARKRMKFREKRSMESPVNVIRWLI